MIFHFRVSKAYKHCRSWLKKKKKKALPFKIYLTNKLIDKYVKCLLYLLHFESNPLGTRTKKKEKNIYIFFTDSSILSVFEILGSVI